MPSERSHERGEEPRLCGPARRRTGAVTPAVAAASASRELSDQIEPFDRDDFASWLGALRMAIPQDRQRCATTPRRKRTRPPVEQIGSPGSLRRSPDAQASRFTPRLPARSRSFASAKAGLPGKPIRLHQIDSIWSDSALGITPHDSNRLDRDSMRDDFSARLPKKTGAPAGCAPAPRRPGSGRGRRVRWAAPARPATPRQATRRKPESDS